MTVTSEQRFLTTNRMTMAESGNLPGLVLGDDGVIYTVAADGTRGPVGAAAVAAETAARQAADTTLQTNLTAGDAATLAASKVYTDAAGAPSRRDILLKRWGILDEPFDIANLNTGIAVVSQTVYQVTVGLRKGDVVTNIVVHTANNPAVGTAPTLIRMGLCDSSSNVVAVTANVATSSIWLTNGLYQVPLTAPYTVPTTDLYMPVFLIVGAFGTTTLQIGAKTAALSTLTNQIGTGPRRNAVSVARTSTDLPAVGQPLPAMATNYPVVPYLAVS